MASLVRRRVPTICQPIASSPVSSSLSCPKYSPSSLLQLCKPPSSASRQLFRPNSSLATLASSAQQIPNGGQNGLSKVIQDTIRATGPMSVARYMQLCLSHPVQGYYSRGDVFGVKGDFITSPEISQIFGELVAIWLLTRWMAAGNPQKTRIIELGPGRGTLMSDILRTFSSFPAISSALTSIHLVENSMKMRQVQRQKLSEYEKRSITIKWYDSIGDVPPSDEFTLFVAHEFFDAMPINVFEMTEQGFREVCVDLNPSYDPKLVASSQAPLRLAVSREPTTLSSILPSSSRRWARLPVGSRIEVASDSWKIMRRLGELIKQEEGEESNRGSGGGAGLVVDYGGDRTFGSSFRAFRNHKIVDPLEQPGSSDLTANVDFAYLKESIDGIARPLGPISQSQFLLSLGMQTRLSRLVASAPSPEREEELRKGAMRLIDTLGMGAQYQVMGVVGLGQREKEKKEGVEEVYPFVFLPPPSRSALSASSTSTLNSGSSLSSTSSSSSPYS